MKSKTFEQTIKFYNENKVRLIEVMFNEFTGEIDYQPEFNQVAVWFNGFSLCYQNSDMNGCGKGEPHWDNDGANCGLPELRGILSNDIRFQPLIAEDEYWPYEYIDTLINDFCGDFAEKYKIADYFENDI